jgi:hypothetical protein
LREEAIFSLTPIVPSWEFNARSDSQKAALTSSRALQRPPCEIIQGVNVNCGRTAGGCLNFLADGIKWYPGRAFGGFANQQANPRGRLSESIKQNIIIKNQMCIARLAFCLVPKLGGNTDKNLFSGLFKLL